MRLCMVLKKVAGFDDDWFCLTLILRINILELKHLTF